MIPDFAMDWLIEVSDSLHNRFGICHPTVQIELGEGECKLAPDHVV